MCADEVNVQTQLDSSRSYLCVNNVRIDFTRLEDLKRLR